ncbi:MAG: C25 family cysteine peptidase [Flavobacteriales bacterium]|nr:C25 family cysteine peptidase [Flavobacteriales bacterium]
MLNRIFCALLAVALFAGPLASQQNSAYTTLLQDGPQGTVIEFNFSDPEFTPVQTSEGEALVPHVLGDHSLLKAGSPDLSQVSATIIIDSQSHTALEVLDVEFVEFQDIDIAPSQGNLYRDVDPSTVPRLAAEVYAVDAFFPAVHAQLNQPFIQRGMRGQTVRVFPFQYNPVQRVLRVMQTVKLRVYEVEGVGANVLSSNAVARNTPAIQHAMEGRFLNAQTSQDRYDYIQEFGKIIVLTDPMYDDVLAPLVQWKIEKGWETQVVYAEDLGGDIDQIKAHLADAYFNDGLTHVIIAGDEDQVPSELVSNGGGDGYCDPCYAYVEGNDHYPEFFVGRLLTHTVEEMASVVSRTLEYEKMPFLGEDWFTTGIVIGSEQGAGAGDEGQADWQHLNAIKDLLLDYSYTEVWELYDQDQSAFSVSTDGTGDDPGSPNSNDMVELVNKGGTFFNYCGHGYHEGIATTGFDVNAIETLLNYNMYGFISTVACCVGDFDEGEGSGDCFGEVWIKAEGPDGPTGGIGGAFSSVLQSWAPPMEGQDEMVNLVVGAGDVTIAHTTGSIVAHGNASMIDEYGAAGEEMMDTWCVFGDPTVVLRTDDPTQIECSHPDVVFLGAPNIQVLCPIEGALIAVTTGDQILGTSFVSGGLADVVFSNPLSTPATLLVTATAHNTIPYQAEITAVPADGPYVFAQNAGAVDVTGDLDGVVDQGESIELDLNLENVGVDLAGDVMVTISTTDPWVVITAGELPAGDIAAGEALLLEGFGFDVVAGVEDQHAVTFNILATDDADNAWNTSFNITLNAPVLTVVGLTVLDGGNGILESGETADLAIEVLNTGHDVAYDLAGLIDLVHPDVTVNNASFDVGTLAENTAATLLFNITISPDAGDGEMAYIGFSGAAGLYDAADDFIEIINLVIENWESGTTEAFPWGMSGNEDWFVSTNQPYQGDNCLESGGIDDSQSTALTISLQFLADGNVTFARRVDTEDGWDFLYFKVDGEEAASWSGQLDWDTESFELTAGYHTLEWIYIKDNIISSGADACWVDDITFPPFCYIDAQVVSSSGDNLLCPGESLTLSTTEGYETMWNTGATASTLEVTEPGTYYVSLSDGACTAASEPFNVVLVEPIEPVIDFMGQLELCAGDVLTLSAPDGGTYLWSGGSLSGLTAQTVVVSEAGTYGLLLTDACGQVNESALLEVGVNPLPDTPVVSNVVLETPGNVIFEGDVPTLSWFDQAEGGAPLATGQSFEVYADASTSYWVQNEASYDPTVAQGGKQSPDDIGQHHPNPGYYLEFDAYQPFTLESVVVHAFGAAMRTIALFTAEGQELASATVLVPNGESVVDLGFFVPTGAGMTLRSMDDSPMLWRDGVGSEQFYPYALGSAGAITGTSVAGANSESYYYFFYDWSISMDAVGCVSERIEVMVDVLSSVGEIEGLSRLNVYPNPTSDMLWLELELEEGLAASMDLQVELLDMTGRIIRTSAWQGVSSGRHGLDLTSCASGLYMLRLTDGMTAVLERVVIR